MLAHGDGKRSGLKLVLTGVLMTLLVAILVGPTSPSAWGQTEEPFKIQIATNPNPPTGPVPLKVQFEGTITQASGCPPLNPDQVLWTWNFGDGSPAASGRTVTKTYQNTGTYTVVLSAIAINCGTDTTTTTVVATSSSATVQLIATPSNVNFGPVLVRSSSSVSVQLSNIGTLPVQISSLALRGGSPFRLQGPATPLTLPANTSRAITITFSPGAAGVFQDAVDVIYGASGEALLLTVPVQGTGTTGGGTGSLRADLSIDRGCGATYRINDPITIRFSLSQDGRVTLRLRLPDGSERVVLNNEAVRAGVVNTLPGTVAEPAGSRLLILEGTAGGLSARAECSFTAVGGNPAASLIGQIRTERGCQERGENPLYSAGDTLTVFFRVDGTPSVFAQVWYVNAVTGARQQLFSGQVSGGQERSLNVRIDPASEGGLRRLELQAQAGNEGFQTLAQCGFQVQPRQQPSLQVSPSAIDFGDVEVNAQGRKTVSVSNAGTGDLLVNRLEIQGGTSFLFSFCESSSASFTLRANESRTFNLCFSPKAEGRFTATLAVQGSGQSASVSLSGRGIVSRVPRIEVVPLEIVFLNTEVQRISQKPLTVRNRGTGILTVTSMNLQGADKSVFRMCDPFQALSIAPGADETFAVCFQPSAARSYQAELVINSSDPERASVSITLKGAGMTVTTPTTPRIEAPQEVAFPATDVEKTSQRPVTLSNRGAGTLTITSLVIDGGAKSAFKFCDEKRQFSAFPIAPGAETTIAVCFQPSAALDYQAELVVKSNDPERPSVTVSLKGSGLGVPVIKIDPDILDFGEIYVHWTEPRQMSFRIINEGSAELKISSINAKRRQPFSLCANFSTPVTIKPGNSIEVAICGKSTTVGDYVDEVQIQDNDPKPDKTVLVRAKVRKFTQISCSTKYKVINTGAVNIFTGDLIALGISGREFVQARAVELVVSFPNLSGPDKETQHTDASGSFFFRYEQPGPIGQYTANVWFDGDSEYAKTHSNTCSWKVVDDPPGQNKPSKITCSTYTEGGRKQSTFFISEKYNVPVGIRIRVTRQDEFVSGLSNRLDVIVRPPGTREYHSRGFLDETAGKYYAFNEYPKTYKNRGQGDWKVEVYWNGDEKTIGSSATCGWKVMDATATTPPSVEPYQLDFPATRIGGTGSSSMDVQIGNAGISKVLWQVTTSVSSDEGTTNEFSVYPSDKTFALKLGDKRTVPVGFAPKAFGDRTGLLRLQFQDPDNAEFFFEERVTLSGKGYITEGIDVGIELVHLQPKPAIVGKSLEFAVQVWNQGNKKVKFRYAVEIRDAQGKWKGSLAAGEDTDVILEPGDSQGPGGRSKTPIIRAGPRKWKIPTDLLASDQMYAVMKVVAYIMPDSITDDGIHLGVKDVNPENNQSSQEIGIFSKEFARDVISCPTELWKFKGSMSLLGVGLVKMKINGALLCYSANRSTGPSTGIFSVDGLGPLTAVALGGKDEMVGYIWKAPYGERLYSLGGAVIVGGSFSIEFKVGPLGKKLVGIDGGFVYLNLNTGAQGMFFWGPGASEAMQQLQGDTGDPIAEKVLDKIREMIEDKTPDELNFEGEGKQKIAGLNVSLGLSIGFKFGGFLISTNFKP